ncbi:MAG: helix-turn-helix transcriptional regulator [Oscillospiraceae bacterium]|nr:helix-turn-helix transcriptional regulator [Oscillospiraceae bacterium]
MRIKKQINIEIGERIKQAREAAHLTQEVFAERIEVSPQYVSDLERGVVGGSIPTIKRICMVLGITADYVLFGAKETKSLSLIEDKIQKLTQLQTRCLINMIDQFIAAVNEDSQSPE